MVVIPLRPNALRFVESSLQPTEPNRGASQNRHNRADCLASLVTTAISALQRRETVRCWPKQERRWTQSSCEWHPPVGLDRKSADRGSNRPRRPSQTNPESRGDFKMKWTTLTAAMVIAASVNVADAGLFGGHSKGNYGCCAPAPSCCCPSDCCAADPCCEPTCCAPAATCCDTGCGHDHGCCAPAPCCDTGCNDCCAPAPCCDTCAPVCCAPKRHGLLHRLRCKWRARRACKSNCCAPAPSCCAPTACCAPTCAAPCGNGCHSY